MKPAHSIVRLAASAGSDAPTGGHRPAQVRNRRPQTIGSCLTGGSASSVATLPVLLTAAFLHGCGSSGGGSPDVQPPPPPALPQPTISLSLTEPFTALPSFDQPLAMLQAPGDDTRWFVVERAGLVKVFDNDPGASSTETFIDLRSQVNSGPEEAGLLGMAFHPDFQSNQSVFLSFTRTGLVSYVSSFTSNDGGVTLDPGSEAVILTVVQDFTNHNGGHLAFGPDGYLYIGFGDGGAGDDPNNRAQTTTNLPGSIVRVDVDSASPYAIPADNPFAGNPDCVQGFGSANCPELFAWGLRNPWRFSFDMPTGQLWAGDVGQDRFEEINLIASGGNYGWRVREGAHCNIPSGGCDTTGLIDPVAEYDHGEGLSITGGYVYRGSAIPALDGVYLYADFISGRLWGLIDDGLGNFEQREFLQSGLLISSFGQASNGELFLIDYGTGRLHQIVNGP